MRYYLHTIGLAKFMFLHNAADDLPLECPYPPVQPRTHCGSWCPLFDLRERDRIPQVDAPDLVRLEVKLHCGAGTRVIDVECGEKGGVT